MSSTRSKRGKADDMPDGGESGVKRRRISSSDEDDKRASSPVTTPSLEKLIGDLPPLNGLHTPRSSSNNKPAELFRKDLISAMKMPDSEPLMQDDYFYISDPWRQEWERGVQVPVNDVTSIPGATSRAVRENEHMGGEFSFKLPRKMLHATADETYRQACHELTNMSQLAEQVCRYDLDELDVKWLERFNEEREDIGEPLLDEWTMEKVMEELESQCHENMQETIKTEEGLGIEYDENVICDVCRSPDSEDNNEMVFCDGCDVCVHQACYGITTIPEGSWLCRICALGLKPQCILCPKVGGAMKSTKSGSKWAHVSCALWIPEVSIGCVEKMEPITKISHIPPSRWNLTCVLCRERTGSCIQCAVKTCKTAFHVTCAFEHQLEMKTILLEEGDQDDGVKLQAFCVKHTTRKGRMTVELTAGSPGRRDGLGTPKKEMTEEEQENLRQQRLERLEDEFYNCVRAMDVAATLKVEEEVVDAVYSFWLLKRKTNHNRPLLMPKAEEADMLTKQQEDSLIARMRMFVHLRQDLERVRNLCYMVSKREKIRRTLYKNKEEVFIKQLAVLNDTTIKLNQKELKTVYNANKSGDFYDQPDFIMQCAEPFNQIIALDSQDSLSGLTTSTVARKLDLSKESRQERGKGKASSKDRGGKKPAKESPNKDKEKTTEGISKQEKVGRARRDSVKEKLDFSRRESAAEKKEISRQESVKARESKESAESERKEKEVHRRDSAKGRKEKSDFSPVKEGRQKSQEIARREAAKERRESSHKDSVRDKSESFSKDSVEDKSESSHKDSQRDSSRDSQGDSWKETLKEKKGASKRDSVKDHHDHRVLSKGGPNEPLKTKTPFRDSLGILSNNGRDIRRRISARKSTDTREDSSKEPDLGSSPKSLKEGKSPFKKDKEPQRPKEPVEASPKVKGGAHAQIWRGREPHKLKEEGPQKVEEQTQSLKSKGKGVPPKEKEILSPRDKAKESPLKETEEVPPKVKEKIIPKGRWKPPFVTQKERERMRVREMASKKESDSSSGSESSSSEEDEEEVETEKKKVQNNKDLAVKHPATKEAPLKEKPGAASRERAMKKTVAVKPQEREEREADRKAKGKDHLPKESDTEAGGDNKSKKQRDSLPQGDISRRGEAATKRSSSTHVTPEISHQTTSGSQRLSRRESQEHSRPVEQGLEKRLSTATQDSHKAAGKKESASSLVEKETLRDRSSSRDAEKEGLAAKPSKHAQSRVKETEVRAQSSSKHGQSARSHRRVSGTEAASAAKDSTPAASLVSRKDVEAEAAPEQDKTASRSRRKESKAELTPKQATPAARSRHGTKDSDPFTPSAQAKPPVKEALVKSPLKKVSAAEPKDQSQSVMENKAPVLSKQQVQQERAKEKAKVASEPLVERTQEGPPEKVHESRPAVTKPVERPVMGVVGTVRERRYSRSLSQERLRDLHANTDKEPIKEEAKPKLKENLVHNKKENQPVVRIDRNLGDFTKQMTHTQPKLVESKDRNSPIKEVKQLVPMRERLRERSPKKEIHGVLRSKLVVGVAIREKVHRNTLKLKRMKPYMNGLNNDRSQRRLDSYFKPIPPGRNSPNVKNEHVKYERASPPRYRPGPRTAKRRINRLPDNEGSKLNDTVFSSSLEISLSNYKAPSKSSSTSSTCSESSDATPSNRRDSINLDDDLDPAPYRNSPETRSARKRIASDLQANINGRLFENVDDEISICHSSRDTTPERESVTRRGSKSDLDFHHFNKRLVRNESATNSTASGGSDDESTNVNSDSESMSDNESEHSSYVPPRRTRSRGSENHDEGSRDSTASKYSTRRSSENWIKMLPTS